MFCSRPPGALLLIVFLLCSCQSPSHDAALPLLQPPPPSPGQKVGKWFFLAKYTEPPSDSPARHLRDLCTLEESGSVLEPQWRLSLSGRSCPLTWHVSRTSRGTGGSPRIHEVKWSLVVPRAWMELDAGDCEGRAIRWMGAVETFVRETGNFSFRCAERLGGEGTWEEQRWLNEVPLRKVRRERLEVTVDGLSSLLSSEERVEGGRRTVKREGNGREVTEDVYLSWWNWAGTPHQILDGESPGRSSVSYLSSPFPANFEAF